ncbi:hypothetical protein pb186bvf_008132 [Paramecium bursaria]
MEQEQDKLGEKEQIYNLIIQLFEIDNQQNPNYLTQQYYNIKEIIKRVVKQGNYIQMNLNSHSYLISILDCDQKVWIQFSDIAPIIQIQSEEQIKQLEDQRLQFQLKFEEQKEKNTILQSEVDMYYEQSLKSSRKISQFQSKEKIILDSFYKTLQTVPWLTQQQIYSFSDNSKIKPSPIKDLEDAKMLVEVKNSQILQLKGMMIENFEGHPLRISFN